MDNMGHYDNYLKYISKNGNEHTFDKLKVFKEVRTKFDANFDILDLEKQISKLIKFIKESNDFY